MSKRLLTLPVVALVFVSCSDDDDTTLEAAASECGVEASEVENEGSSISFVVQDVDDVDGSTLETVRCVLRETDAPDRVTSLIEEREQSGDTMREAWEAGGGTEIEASWTYSSDAGLTITLTERPPAAVVEP